MLAVTGALGGCGESDGGSGFNEPPRADPGPDLIVEPLDQVTLMGSGVDRDGVVTRFSWQQRSGPSVTLAGADSAAATFQAPASTTVLEFELTVTDNGGETGSARVTVTVVPNQPPTAYAGFDARVLRGSAVSLAGRGIDVDGTVVGYRWAQVDGPNVSLGESTSSSLTFTAPPAATTLTFELIVTDDDGDPSLPDTVTLTVVDQAPAQVAIRGYLDYEFVNPGRREDNGLDYSNVSVRPIRGATVQAIDGVSQSVIATTVSDATGAYELFVGPNSQIFVRVRAELKRQGRPGWDVELRDNTSNTIRPLAGRPLYALDGAVADTTSGDTSRNLLAASGWDGTRYVGVRAAAPFSILDAIYSAIELVLSADPNAEFPPLDAFWSVNNCPTVGNEDAGAIGTSFYRPDIDSLFLLGCEDVDTEEFDTHVVAHEWGHYFEDVFSRSDSLGGAHNGADQLDMRVAFGEGWGNAVSAMIIGNPRYRDTFGSSQAESFELNVEDDPTENQGWFSTVSVQSFLYDLYDSSNTGPDSVTLGFTPLYQALVGPQRNTSALTSVFSFAEALKQVAPESASAVDALLSSQNIAATDRYGTDEVNDAGGGSDVLPIFTPISRGQSVTVCSTRAFDPRSDGNKLGTYRFLRFMAPTSDFYDIEVRVSGGQTVRASDPDLLVISRGQTIAIAESSDPGLETLSVNLAAGEYIIEVYEFQFTGNSQPISARRVCFDVMIR